MRHELIRQAMEANQLQTSDLALAMRSHKGSISRILNGASKYVGTTMAVKLCGVLRIGMQALFQDEIDAFAATLPRVNALVAQVPARRIDRSESESIVSQAMERKGISPATCASLCAVSRTYMSLVIGGQTRISLRMAIKLAAVLDLTLDEIYRQEIAVFQTS